MVLVLDCVLMVRSVFQGWRIGSDKLRSILRLQAFACFSDCILFLFTYSDCKYILRIKSLFPVGSFWKPSLHVYSSLITNLYIFSTGWIFPSLSQLISWKYRSYFTRYREPNLMNLRETSSEKPEVFLWEAAMLFQSKEKSKRRTSDALSTCLALLLELHPSTYRSWSSPRAEERVVHFSLLHLCSPF